MREEIDRRRFLKASAQGVAIAGIAGVAGRIPLVFAETTNKDNPSEWISEVIREFTATSPLNSLKKTDVGKTGDTPWYVTEASAVASTKKTDDAEKAWGEEKAWDTPLVGFANGGDAVFADYKDKVGPFHWTPAEIFAMTFPDTPVKPEELTVIAWILPTREAIKADLRKETKNPAERWVRARIFGDVFNEELHRHVAESLIKAGYPAVAPTMNKEFKTQNSEKYGLASNWSERHAAYAAGLGTFGLCDGLITAKGKAMRCGAVVAKMPATPTPRPYTDHHAYCLHYAKGTCGICIARCPGKAVTKEGHDKTACYKQLGVTAQYAKEHFGIDGYGCGFCQTATPCESRIPV
ncbi:MAG: epoxyqueuosine reductase [Acidobacteriota bacterium]|jgi:ferredoxin|nr:epoxyqueuosine reductase [Acidobacteriota bacterium]